MVTLNLNKNQAEVLLSVLDIAIKSGGLNVAEAAVFFSKSIEHQFNKTDDITDDSADADE